jgi:DHA1 family tetracycline resistance protein-like MFS transporter
MNGLSLAVVGVAAAIVQGGLVRRIVPRLGEARSLLAGISLTTLAMLLYGIAPSGTAMLCIIPIGSLGAIAGPALQGLVTGVVPDDRQGAVQGSLASVQSLTAIVSPLVATKLFEKGVAWGFPGAPFWLSAACLVVAFGLAWRATSRHAPTVSP